MTAAAARSLLFAVVLLAAAGQEAAAHTGGSNGYAVITLLPEGARYSLTLWPSALPPEVVDDIRRARAGETASRERLLAMVRDRVTLTAAGRRCQGGAGSVPSPSAESLTLVVDFACGGPVTDLQIRDDLFDVLGADYHTLARIEGPGGATQFAFAPDARETRVRLGGWRATIADAGSFVLLGIEHILVGWDHLLFLVGLLLRGGGWLALVKIVTAFTLAHSVTLAMAALQIVALPERLVEGVIALSIAFVAAENLVREPVVRRRWLVGFGFGLVHGFGFASALGELGLAGGRLALALVGFNLGVEIGQALVLAVAMPLLVLVRRAGWEPSIVRASSVAVLLVGVALFVERVLL